MKYLPVSRHPYIHMRTDSAAQQIRFAAIAVFVDVAAASRWMTAPNLVLGGLTPEASAQTHPGFMRTLDVLYAIKTGSAG